MEDTTFVKSELEWSVDAEESCNNFQGLPLKTDHDDSGDIKIQLDDMATLLAKVERGSSPSGLCEGNRRDEELFPLPTNDRSAMSSDMVDQNEAKVQGRTGYSRDLLDDHNYATSTGDLCIGSSRSMIHIQHEGESQSSVRSFKTAGLILPDADKAAYIRNIPEAGRSSDTSEQHARPTCGRAISNKSTFPVHPPTHNNDQPYDCCFCDKSFAFKDSFMKHLLFHAADKIVVCKVCGEYCTGRMDFETHMEKHANGKLRICPICDKAFPRHYNLQCHIVTAH